MHNALTQKNTTIVLKQKPKKKKAYFHFINHSQKNGLLLKYITYIIYFNKECYVSIGTLSIYIYMLEKEKYKQQLRKNLNILINISI